MEGLGTSHACAETIAVLLAMQNAKADMLCFYDMRMAISIFGGMFDAFTTLPTPLYYGFAAFGKLYEMKNQVDLSVGGERIYAVAAEGNGKRGVLIANLGEDCDIKTNLGNDMTVYLIDKGHSFTYSALKSDEFHMAHDQVIYIEGRI